MGQPRKPSVRSSPAPPAATERSGYTVLRWRAAGMVFSAVADLAAEELTDFLKLWQGPSQAS